MTEPLAPGAVIGILGGGQLGRMLSVAAARLGFVCHIFEPGANPPAGQVAAKVTTADYDDLRALRKFAEAVDVITYEFENIPTEALDVLEDMRPVRPGREALRVSQDRLTEKTFLQALGLRTAPFADVPDLAALTAAMSDIGVPAILKSRRFGYDGKGQVRLGADSDPKQALAEMGCNEVQGYLFAKPQPASLAPTLLTTKAFLPLTGTEDDSAPEQLSTVTSIHRAA